MTWWRKLFFVAGLVILTVGVVCNLQGVFGPKVDVFSLVLSGFSATFVIVLYLCSHQLHDEIFEQGLLTRESKFIAFMVPVMCVLFVIAVPWSPLVTVYLASILSLFASMPLPVKPMGNA